MVSDGAARVRELVRRLPDYELREGVFADGAAGLRRTAALLERLGRPDRRPRTAQIAGTNGKGSTAAMLASILQQAGARTGLYTSPHLHRWEERIRISGEPIDDELLGRAGARVAAAAAGLDPALGSLTRFEFWTALACVAFVEAGCLAAVLEVGLGGRYDATSAAHADVAVITRVALDHTAILGTTLAAIAVEKAAIIRGRMPVVCGAQPEEARREIVARARAFACPLFVVGREVAWSRGASGLVVTVRGRRYGPLRLALAGPHQDENAATAVAAAQILSELGLDVAPDAVERGLAATRWPGRFEVARGVVLDGAHNPDGARALAAALRAAFPGERFTFVLGCHRDKDLAGILAELAPLAVRVVATNAESPRARPAVEIAGAARDAGVDAEVGGSVPDALARARRDARVVVTGSLAVVAEARAALGLSG